MQKYHFLFLIFTFFVNINVCRPARSEALPKIIWTYLQPNGNNIIHELSVAKMKSIVEKSRWILQVITPENIFIYIKDHESYKLILKNYARQLEFIEKIEIIKLFILIEYGGVWVDPSVVLLGPLDWILNLEQSQELMKTSDNYEIILFQSVSQIRDQFTKEINDHQILMSTDFILGLKQSPTLLWWLTIFKQKLNKQHEQEEYQDINVLLKQSLSQLLGEDSKPLQQILQKQKIWIYQHLDYIPQFEQQQQEYNSDSISNYLTKYPQNMILKHFKKPQNYFKLGQVAEYINIIINPNISKLAYLPNSQGFTQHSAELVKCAHFLEISSIIFTNLVKQSIFQGQLAAITQNYKQINAYCSQAYENQTIKNIFLALKYLIISAVVCVLIKLYYILLTIIYKSVLIIVKPKCKILRRKLAMFIKIYRTIQEEGI